VPAWIVPISGTAKLHRIEENLGAVNVELTENDLKQIDEAASQLTLMPGAGPSATLETAPAQCGEPPPSLSR
jgi:diketogulonate reductase-like aldo/keto reductase